MVVVVFDIGMDHGPSQSKRKTSNLSRKLLIASLLPVRQIASEAILIDGAATGDQIGLEYLES